MLGVGATNPSFLRRCSNYFGNLRRSEPSKFPEKLAVMTQSRHVVPRQHKSALKATCYGDNQECRDGQTVRHLRPEIEPGSVRGARSNPRLHRDRLTYRTPWERSEPVSASGENGAFCFAGFWGLGTARLREFRFDAMDNLFPLATANWKASVRLPHR